VVVTLHAEAGGRKKCNVRGTVTIHALLIAKDAHMRIIAGGLAHVPVYNKTGIMRCFNNPDNRQH
jgi:hypothetical protein